VRISPQSVDQEFCERTAQCRALGPGRTSWQGTGRRLWMATGMHRRSGLRRGLYRSPRRRPHRHTGWPADQGLEQQLPNVQPPCLVAWQCRQRVVQRQEAYVVWCNRNAETKGRLLLLGRAGLAGAWSLHRMLAGVGHLPVKLGSSWSFPSLRGCLTQSSLKAGRICTSFEDDKRRETAYSSTTPSRRAPVFHAAARGNDSMTVGAARRKRAPRVGRSRALKGAEQVDAAGARFFCCPCVLAGVIHALRFHGHLKTECRNSSSATTTWVYS
jgi:hypothetical protein